MLRCSYADELPLQYQNTPGIECPAPPLLAEEEVPLLAVEEDSQLSGPLDSHNHFVAEHFLRRARDLERSVFFREAQAAFVFASDEPSGGGCRSTAAVNESTAECNESIAECNESIAECNESIAECNESIAECNESIAECNETTGEETFIAAFYEDISNLTVTIWYNNQVGKLKASSALLANALSCGSPPNL